MIADRDIFIVGQQRLVGAELKPDIGGVVNPDVKVGVVADRARQMHCRLDRGEQMRLGRGALGLARQQVRQQATHCARLVGAVPEPGIERRLAQRGQPAVVEQPGLGEPANIDDALADRHPDTWASPERREDPERQVLDRIERVAVGAGDPAYALWIVGFVGHCGNLAFGKSAQAAS